MFKSQRNYNLITINYYLITIFIIFSFLILNFASALAADTGGLVSCSGLDCKFCDLLTLAERVINFGLYYIAVPLVVIFIIYGGFVILTAGDKPERVSDGRKIITSAIIGLLIALLAWMLINIIINVLAPGGINQWWNPAAELDCP